MSLRDKLFRRENKIFRRDLLNTIQANSGEWPDEIPAILGDLSGVVLTDIPGVNWARFENGHPFKVQNWVVPEIFDTKVYIAKGKSSTLWQVVRKRQVYANDPNDAYVRFHAAQHYITGPDAVFIDRKQLLYMSVLPSQSDPFTLQVYGAPTLTSDGWKLIEHQTVDLESYIPTAGAQYIGIEIDSDGIVSVNDTGVSFPAPNVPDIDNFPVPVAGKIPIAVVLLFESMEEIIHQYISIPMPLTFNYGDLAHTHPANELDIMPGHLHGITRWNGISGQTTFELPDYWEYIEQVFINGVSEDPLNYSLSADRDQIILDNALPADLPVWAQGVIAEV